MANEATVNSNTTMSDKQHLVSLAGSGATYIEEITMAPPPRQPSRTATCMKIIKICANILIYVCIATLFLFGQYAQRNLLWKYIREHSKGNEDCVDVLWLPVVGGFIISTASAVDRAFIDRGGKGHLWFTLYFILGLIIVQAVELAVIPLGMLVRAIWAGLEGVTGISTASAITIGFNGTTKTNSSSIF